MPNSTPQTVQNNHKDLSGALASISILGLCSCFISPLAYLIFLSSSTPNGSYLDGLKQSFIGTIAIFVLYISCTLNLIFFIRLLLIFHQSKKIPNAVRPAEKRLALCATIFGNIISWTSFVLTFLPL